MYLAYYLILLIGVYLAPAIALFPKLVISSRTAVVIPIISVICIAIIKNFLAYFDALHHIHVVSISI